MLCVYINNKYVGFKMKTKLLSGLYFILLLLIIFNCTKTPANIAVSSDGVNISFDVQGEGEPTLLFVHGWSGNKKFWNNQVTHFSKKYRVVTIDLASFGESGNNRKLFDMASFGADIASVINKLKLEQVVLVGHSMGGPSIIEAYKLTPNPIKALVLVDVLKNVEQKYSQKTINSIDSLYMDLVTTPTFEKLKPFWNTKKLELSERYISLTKNDIKTNWSESIRDYFRWSNEDCIESIKNIHVPIMSINSDQVQTKIDAFRKYNPTFKAKIIPGVNHYVFWESPVEFNRLLEDSIQEVIHE